MRVTFLVPASDSVALRMAGEELAVNIATYGAGRPAPFRDWGSFLGEAAPALRRAKKKNLRRGYLGDPVSERQAARLAAAAGKLAGNAAEYAVQRRADRVHSDDDHDGDTGRDQGVFDRCCTALITHGAQN